MYLNIQNQYLSLIDSCKIKKDIKIEIKKEKEKEIEKWKKLVKKGDVKAETKKEVLGIKIKKEKENQNNIEEKKESKGLLKFKETEKEKIKKEEEAATTNETQEGNEKQKEKEKYKDNKKESAIPQLPLKEGYIGSSFQEESTLNTNKKRKLFTENVRQKIKEENKYKIRRTGNLDEKKPSNTTVDPDPLSNNSETKSLKENNSKNSIQAESKMGVKEKEEAEGGVEDEEELKEKEKGEGEDEDGEEEEEIKTKKSLLVSIKKSSFSGHNINTQNKTYDLDMSLSESSKELDSPCSEFQPSTESEPEQIEEVNAQLEKGDRSKKGMSKKRRRNKRYHNLPRPQDPPPEWDKWSYVKQDAWLRYFQNLNSYYYRFNEKGEKDKKGKWSEEEEKLFERRLVEFGPRDWGLFSISIPGRCGTMFSNHFRSRLLHEPEFFVKWGSDFELNDGKLKFVGVSRIQISNEKKKKQAKLENEALQLAVDPNKKKKEKP
ncbi:transcription factor myb44-like [Anaeramoeba flamelloides]|uniref:Transcription factor myb44-like n=1 Tax=Anaeramoeba flamelloides TaxID=1746091 RepID=A0AAV7YEE6_9EUKA|nr:transcription factor myb44-like [Anaeramoeba flamelloides]